MLLTSFASAFKQHLVQLMVHIRHKHFIVKQAVKYMDNKS